MSGSKYIRVGLAAVLLAFLCAAPVAANPFLGGSGSAPAPVAVRGGAGPFAALQLAFRDRAGAALTALKDDPAPEALLALLLGSFVYGLFHAAGPGHRKAVMFSLFLSRKARAWEPAAAGVLSAGVHAATGIAIIAVFSLARGAVASLAHVDGAGTYLEGFTFLALGLIAAFFALRTVADLASGRGHSHGGRDERVAHGHGHGDAGEDRVAHGHGHGDAAEDRDHDPDGRRLYTIAALTSLVPCPGATMMLLFALYLDLAFLGILAVLAMSAGMAVVVSAAGYLAYFGREGIFLRLKASEKAVGFASGILELGSYLFLAAFSFLAAWPFLASLLRTLAPAA